MWQVWFIYYNGDTIVAEWERSVFASDPDRYHAEALALGATHRSKEARCGTV